MFLMYILILIFSIGLMFYTAINALLTVKYINRLSTNTKNKYLPLANMAKNFSIISFVCLGINFIFPEILFRCLFVVLNVLLNGYILSEITVLKKYI